MYESFEARLNKNEHAILHYTRTCVEIKTIAVGSNRFNDELFPSANEIPTRIFITLLNNDQLSGSMKANPFHLRRLFREFNANGAIVPNSDVYVKSTSMSIQGIDISGNLHKK